MRKRVFFGMGLVLLAILVTLVIWQSSFSFGDFDPTTATQTYVFWAVSTLVFLLTITIGFMLFKTALKLYVERQRNKEGSRIKTRLVFGALALSFMPVLFLVLFSVSVLNFNIARWFSRPGQNIRWSLIEVGVAMDHEAQLRAKVLARMLTAAQEQPGPELEKFCAEQNVEQAWTEGADGQRTFLCGGTRQATARSVEGRAPFGADAQIVVRLLMPIDFAAKQKEISHQVAEYDLLAKEQKQVRNLYLLLLFLITLFILFVATWIARFMARQISDPISALLEAAEEVRKGNLAYRIQGNALDELGVLVRAFNQMTHDLDANSRELERRRRFTEAILESIPTGVISLAADGSIQRYNQALSNIFPALKPEKLTTVDHLLPSEEAREIRYLMKRARRTGVASRQIDFRRGRTTMHLAVTVADLEDEGNSGFVVVIEDTSDLLRAQKAAAWHEVARRVAHEIKNPLTPIALCAERAALQLDRLGIPSDSSRILRECCQTILSEVESVKTLVDEFSRFARFPSAQPAPGDLNEVVEAALAVFHGRLDGIELRKELEPHLPAVNIDREQLRRAVVNLVDNAAEAMQDSHVRRLSIVTRTGTPEAVELIIADTGCGVSPEDRERLFLPTFSTKGRGTGLGLAIVNHILSEHHAHIRVEDNVPVGAQFIVEIPVAAGVEADYAGAGA
ncbi:MAG: Adaptive-response sensory-kinase SasA [Bryobacteraceae bacterium]|nr:Adaptive-response sensory-kinase SasA [Bryobacteraceae bacterium]